MPVNVPVPTTYLSFVGSIFTQIRDRFNDAVKQREYITSMGGLTFLTNPQPDGLGMAQPDAQALIAALDQHFDLYTAYTGGAAPPVLDYRDNASPFWGGA
jgi:hypothetical protein